VRKENVQAIEMIRQLPSLHGLTELVKINKGYSPDRKYLVTVGEMRYMVRIADLVHHDKRAKEFSLLQDLAKQGVRTHKAVEYTLFQEANVSAMVVSFLEGTPADEVIQELSDAEQF